MLTRSRFLGASLACLLPFAAPAQTWPTQAIKIILPTPAGIGPDAWLRRIAPRLSERLGQPVVVENKPGGNGIIGARSVLAATPDGYTLLFTSVAEILAVKYLSPASSFDTTSFVPVMAAMEPQMFLVASPKLPAKNMQEFIALARARKGEITFGTSGVGSPFHLTAQSMSQTAHVELTHVPYKGTLAAIQDVIGARLDSGFGSVAGIGQFMQQGQLRPLAVLSHQRNKRFADVPTIYEAVPGITLPPDWFGFWAPSGTPQSVVAALNKALLWAMDSPDNANWLQSNGFVQIGSTPEKQAEMARLGRAAYDPLARAVNLRPE
ncbi:MAG: tripartite tricarboxylate transporter substrate binding protein [Comamonas sp.]